MRKFVYLLVDENGITHFVYDHKDLAEKLMAPLSAKTGISLSIKKIQINQDLASVIV